VCYKRKNGYIKTRKEKVGLETSIPNVPKRKESPNIIVLNMSVWDLGPGSWAWSARFRLSTGR